MTVPVSLGTAQHQSRAWVYWGALLPHPTNERSLWVTSACTRADLSALQLAWTPANLPAQILALNYTHPRSTHLETGARTMSTQPLLPRDRESDEDGLNGETRRLLA